MAQAENEPTSNDDVDFSLSEAPNYNLADDEESVMENIASDIAIKNLSEDELLNKYGEEVMDKFNELLRQTN